MDRFAIFVDAAYLYSEGGKLCHDTGDRPSLILDFQKTVTALAGIGRAHSGISYLRTYWYDAAVHATPSPSHLVVASIPGVKLRLGRLTLRGQKGVDSRIVRDLIVLAHDRAISAAYVLSGDEDIREGVAAAQDCGVSVVLMGVAPIPGEYNQARSLVQEADDLLTLNRDQVSDWISLRPPQSDMGSVDLAHQHSTLEDTRQMGRQFGEAWAGVNPEKVQLALLGRPRIPQDVDRELLDYGSTPTGTQLSEPHKRSLRDGFWQALDDIVRADLPTAPPNGQPI